jgi:hypothetical protein
MLLESPRRSAVRSFEQMSDRVREWTGVLSQKGPKLLLWSALFLVVLLFLVLAVALFSAVVYFSLYRLLVPVCEYSAALHLLRTGNGTTSGSLAVPAGALTAGTLYDVTLVVVMPETRRNVEAGAVTLETRAGARVARRGLVMAHKGLLIGSMESLALFPAFLVGVWREEQHISVLALPGLEAGQGQPEHQPLELEVTAHADLDVYEAKVIFHAEVGTIRYLLWRWATPAAIAGVLALTFFQLNGLLAVALCALAAWWWWSRSAPAAAQHGHPAAAASARAAPAILSSFPPVSQSARSILLPKTAPSVVASWPKTLDEEEDQAPSSSKAIMKSSNIAAATATPAATPQAHKDFQREQQREPATPVESGSGSGGAPAAATDWKVVSSIRRRKKHR